MLIQDLSVYGAKILQKKRVPLGVVFFIYESRQCRRTCVQPSGRCCVSPQVAETLLGLSIRQPSVQLTYLSAPAWRHVPTAPPARNAPFPSMAMGRAASTQHMLAHTHTQACNIECKGPMAGLLGDAAHADDRRGRRPAPESGQAS